MSSRVGAASVGVELALIALVANACATSRTAPHQIDVEEVGVARLVVENRSLSEIQVYVIHGGARISLGRVPATHSVRLMLPANLLRAGSLALHGESRPRIENRRFVTAPFNVLPGQTVRWRLEATGGRSFVSISGPV